MASSGIISLSLTSDNNVAVSKWTGTGIPQRRYNLAKRGLNLFHEVRVTRPTLIRNLVIDTLHRKKRKPTDTNRSVTRAKIMQYARNVLNNIIADENQEADEMVADEEILDESGEDSDEMQNAQSPPNSEVSDEEPLEASRNEVVLAPLGCCGFCGTEKKNIHHLYCTGCGAHY